MFVKKMDFCFKSLCLAGACTLMSTSNFANEATLYGSLRPAFEYVKADGEKRTAEMGDNSTRVGIKGSYDVNTALKLHFGIEEGFNLRTGEETDYPRNLYLGLSNEQWGSVAIGRLDSSNPTGSPLYSQLSSIVSFAGNDASLTAIGTSIANARNRSSNAIGYKSPEFDGWQVKARYYNSGKSIVNFNAEDPTRSLDLGLDYKHDDFKLGFGFAKDWRQPDAKINKMDQKWQFGLRSTTLQAFQPYVLYGQESYHHTEKSQKDIRYWITGFKLSKDNSTFVVNYMEKDLQRQLDAKQKRYQLAYLYKVNKSLTLQTYYDHFNKNDLKDESVSRGLGVAVKYDFKYKLF